MIATDNLIAKFTVPMSETLRRDAAGEWDCSSPETGTKRHYGWIQLMTKSLGALAILAALIGSEMQLLAQMASPLSEEWAAPLRRVRGAGCTRMTARP